MMITVKIMMLNWVHETSAKAEVLLSEELIGNIVCRVVGDKVLFSTAVGKDVALVVFGAEVVNSLGSGVASTKQIKKWSIKESAELKIKHKHKRFDIYITVIMAIKATLLNWYFFKAV